MLKYYFDECLPENLGAEINVSSKYRSTTHVVKHSHDFYELILVCKNSLMHTLNGEKRKMQKYDMCLISPNDYHFSFSENHQDSPCYYTISIRTDYLENLTSAIGKNFLDSILALRYATVKSQVFEQCKQHLNRALFLTAEDMDKKQFLFQTAVTKLLTEFTVSVVEKQVGRSLVETAYSMMSDNENMNLSIKDIAEKLGYSEEHLIRTFKKHGEQSPSKVFTKIKLDYAGELLISSDYSISYVCDLIGYYSQHYFNKIFKKHFGCSPSLYRKKNSIPF